MGLKMVIRKTYQCASYSKYKFTVSKPQGTDSVVINEWNSL